MNFKKISLLYAYAYAIVIIISGDNLTASQGHEYWQQWLFDQENNKDYQELSNDSKKFGKEFAKVLDGNPFFFGASTSGIQHEGGIESVVDSEGNPADAHIRYCIENEKEIPGDTILLWDNYKMVIPQIKKGLGINMLRISITWSRVEPNEGDFRQDTIDHYVEIVKELKRNGIEPFVTFHHYTNPQWFMDKGDFVLKENNEFFVRFCTKMYDALANHVTYYSTINGAQSYGLRAYYNKDQVPYEENLQKAMEVTAHILDAHVKIYQNIKALYQEKKKTNPELQEPLIGLQTNYHPLDPIITDGISGKFFGLITRLYCKMGNKIQGIGQEDWLNRFFTEGTFSVHIPTKVNVTLHNENALKSIDFIALNAYANRPQIGKKRTNSVIPERQRTLRDDYYACPQIIYRATKDIFENFVKPIQEKYGKTVPIIIAENGISTKNEEQRDWYYKQALIALYRARKDGYPVIAYLPWTATDCYQWHSGPGHSWGLMNVTFTGEKENEKPIIGKVKPGAQFYATFIKNFYKLFSRRK